MLETTDLKWLAPWEFDSLLDSVQISELHELIYSSHREFYDIFSECRESILETIRVQLVDLTSELGQTRALLDLSRGKTSTVGVYSWYPAADRITRQLKSLRILMNTQQPRSSLEMKAELKAFQKEVLPVQGNAGYLARIAVCHSVRKMGFGQYLMRDFESQARSGGSEFVSLHVSAFNEVAIHFYLKEGYDFSQSEKMKYVIMTKRLPPRTS